jgi:hypothetical protein
MKPFLTARWSNLINVTFALKPDLLLPYLPKGVEPDVVNGSAFVSLVAFQFLDTAMFGKRVPFHGYFPEINLRLCPSWRIFRRGFYQGIRAQVLGRGHSQTCVQ